MARIFESHSSERNKFTMRIDLADDLQYRFVIHRILASGNTPENSPHLFELVEVQRGDAVAKRSRGTNDGIAEAESALEDASEPCAHLLPLAQSTNGSNENFTGTVLSSCKGGSVYTYQDITLYQTNAAQTEFTVLGHTSAEQYADGRYFESDGVNAGIPHTQGKELLMDSLLLADEVNGIIGNSQMTYVSAKTSATPVPASLTLQRPTDLIAPSSGANTVRTCLERGTATGNLDCDYASVQKNADGSLTLNPSSPTGIAAINKTTSQAASPPQWKADASKYWAPKGGVA